MDLLAIQDAADTYALMVNLLKGSAKMLYTEQIANECSTAKNVAVDAEADQAAKAGALIARPAISFITDRMCQSGKRGRHPEQDGRSRGTCNVSVASPLT